MTPETKQTILNVLNKLFWKCPPPERIRGPMQLNDPDALLDEWANYWLAELRDMPDGMAINGIKWNGEEFVSE